MSSVKVFGSRLWSIPEIRGVSSLALLRYGTKALALGRLLLVTRWFSPAEMGVYGAALLVLAIAEVTTETGVNVILLKHPKKLLEYIHTAWAVSLVRGAVIALGILVFSHLISSFFDSAAILPLLWFCAAAAAIKGAINPAVISFQQKLEFGKETLYRTPLQILDLLSGLFFAWWWQDVSGLLFGMLIGAVAEVVSSFIIFTLRPNLLKARWKQLTALYKETRVIIVNGIVQYLTEHSDDLLVGRLLGPAALGIYQTAYKLCSAVSIDLASIISQALYPIYAARLDDPQKLAQTFWRTNLFFGLMLLLPFVGVVLWSQTVIELLLGPEWREVGIILPWMFFGAVAKSVFILVSPLGILKNLVKYLLLINVGIISLMLAGIYWLSQTWGVLGAAFAVCVAMSLSLPAVFWLARTALRQKNPVVES